MTNSLTFDMDSFQGARSKELIQNADDAGATELHIAWFQSIPNAQHPLLRGPVLVVLNNASFTFLDSYSIHLAGTCM